MTSIAKEIWKHIHDDAVIRRAIEKDIISMKGLAVYLIKEKKVHASADAIISAIRRYKENKPLEKEYEKAKKVIANSEDIRITSNIINISVEKNRKTQELLQKIFSLVDYEKGELLLIIQGEQSIKVLINEKNRGKVLGVFNEKNIKHIEEKLAEINIKLANEATQTPGIIATLSTELMINNINIYELMSCVPEMLVFVKQKDVVKTYEILFDMCKL